MSNSFYSEDIPIPDGLPPRHFIGAKGRNLKHLKNRTGATVKLIENKNSTWSTEDNGRQSSCLRVNGNAKQKRDAKEMIMKQIQKCENNGGAYPHPESTLNLLDEQFFQTKDDAAEFIEMKNAYQHPLGPILRDSNQVYALVKTIGGDVAACIVDPTTESKGNNFAVWSEEDAFLEKFAGIILGNLDTGRFEAVEMSFHIGNQLFMPSHFPFPSGPLSVEKLNLLDVRKDLKAGFSNYLNGEAHSKVLDVLSKLGFESTLEKTEVVCHMTDDDLNAGYKAHYHVDSDKQVVIEKVTGMGVCLAKHAFISPWSNQELSSRWAVYGDYKLSDRERKSIIHRAKAVKWSENKNTIEPTMFYNFTLNSVRVKTQTKYTGSFKCIEMNVFVSHVNDRKLNIDGYEVCGALGDGEDITKPASLKILLDFCRSLGRSYPN